MATSEPTSAATKLEPEDRVTVDTELERVTEFYVAEDGLLKADTSSTPGVTVTRIYLNGKPVPEDLYDDLYELVMGGLYDEGYSS